MNEPLTLTLWNSILPLAGLCALVCWLPGWLEGRGNLSQRALARAVAVTAVVALFAKYALLSPGQGRLFMADPLGRLGLFLGQSLRAGVIRGPIFAVVWLIRAQGIEERRSLLMEGKP